MLYPEKIAAYLELNPCQGNIFNDYNYGGYLIWKLPSQKVFIDGRMPSWKQYNVDYFGLYDNTIKSTTTRAYVFSKYNIRCVLWNSSPDSKKFLTALKNEGWNTILKEPGSVLLEK